MKFYDNQALSCLCFIIEGLYPVPFIYLSIHAERKSLYLIKYMLLRIKENQHEINSQTFFLCVSGSKRICTYVRTYIFIRHIHKYYFIGKRNKHGVYRCVHFIYNLIM